jgi:hypothetical protein
MKAERIEYEENPCAPSGWKNLRKRVLGQFRPKRCETSRSRRYGYAA